MEIKYQNTISPPTDQLDLAWSSRFLQPERNFLNHRITATDRKLIAVCHIVGFGEGIFVMFSFLVKYTTLTSANKIYVIFTQPLRSGRIWHKRSLTGLNSEFSFS